jgi:hypothetical protein
MSGETTMLNENLITASIEPPLDPLTDIKLIFDFCMDAHCFDAVYAKVLSVEEQKEKIVNHLRITSINEKDRDILKSWMEAGS